MEHSEMYKHFIEWLDLIGCIFRRHADTDSNDMRTLIR